MLSDQAAFFRMLYQKYGWRAVPKFFRFQHRRPFSRSLIQKYAPSGLGIEIGVGELSIAPLSRTILTDGFKSHARSKTQAQFQCRADDLPFPECHFDFLISEHTLEHCGNPLGALREWRRVLKPAGVGFLFLPDARRTFDRMRPRTTLEHLIADDRANTADDDTNHLSEWRALVLDRGEAPHYAVFPLNEHPTRGLIHHHVWEPKGAIEMIQFSGFKLLESHEICVDRTDSFVLVFQK